MSEKLEIQVIEGKTRNKGGIKQTAYYLFDKLYNYIINNKIRTLQIIIGGLLLYLSMRFVILALNIFGTPYFLESIEKVPEQYHFVLMAGLMYLLVRLALLLFNHGYNKILDAFEEGEGEN